MNSEILFLLVMQASDPVDLILLPGIFFFFVLIYYVCKSELPIYLLLLLAGLAFDRSGQRLGRGGG